MLDINLWIMDNYGFMFYLSTNKLGNIELLYIECIYCNVNVYASIMMHVFVVFKDLSSQ